MSVTCKINTLNNTKNLAELIARHAKRSDVILLKGDLGAGKTTFAQFFITYLTNAKNIQSPTFNIVNVYDGEDYHIWHYDLYRIKHREELHEIGIEESLTNGITIIEWPDLVESIMHKNKIIIYLKNDQKTDSRIATVELYGRFVIEEETLLRKLENEFK
jgi:tRNA threonylcarbamoyladenosine biosynthesis protein TsaE